MNTEKWIVTLGFMVTCVLGVFSAVNLKLLGLIIFGLLCLGAYLYFLKPNVGLRQLIILLIPAIILSPTINFLGFIGIRLDDVLLAFGLFVYLSKLALGKTKFEFKLPAFSKSFILFICWIGIAILISSYREPNLYNNRDWLEVYKNIKLLVLLVLIYQLNITKQINSKIFNLTLLFISISAVFGILQYLNLAGINSWLTPYFIADSQVKGLEIHGRVVGTYANPNVFATALLVGVGISLARFFHSYKLRFLLQTLMFMVTIFLTLSRTSLISGVLLIVLIALYSVNKSKKKLLTLFSFVFVPVLALLGLKFAPERFFFRMQNLNDLSQDTSFQARLDMWNGIFQTRTLPYIWTGTGPVGNLRFHYDNEWLMILTTYGVVGVFLTCIFFYGIYRRLGKLDSYAYNFNDIAVKAIIVVWGLSMFMEPVFQQLQLMPLLMILIGALLNKSYEETDMKKRRKLVR